MSRHTEEWDSFDEEPVRSYTANKGGMNKVDGARLTTVMKRLETLEMFTSGKPSSFAAIKFVDSPICALCDSTNHTTDQCPWLINFKSEQVNVSDTYHKADNHMFSKTYNPGWRNRLNFSWKQSSPPRHYHWVGLVFEGDVPF